MGINFLEKKIVGIDIQDYAIELCEITIKSKKKLLTAYNRVIIPAGVIVNGDIMKEAELKKYLLKLFNEANPKAVIPKDVTIVLPASKIFSHFFEFPEGLNNKEVEKALLYEGETIIPFPMSDVYYDFSIIDKAPKKPDSKKKAPKTDKKGGKKEQAQQGTKKVLFAAIEKTVADQYSKVFRSLDLNPSIFGINIDALQYSTEGQIPDKKLALLIDVDTLSVNYVALTNKAIKYFSSNNEGGYRLFSQYAAERNETPDVLIRAKETHKIKTEMEVESIEEFLRSNFEIAKNVIVEKKLERLVSMVIVNGKFSNFPGFLKIAKEYFPKKNIVINNPMNGLVVDPSKFKPVPNANKDYYPYSIYFSNAIGVALVRSIGNSSKNINLLPDDIKKELVAKKRTFIKNMMAMSMTAVMLMVSSLMIIKQSETKFIRQALESQKSTIEKTLEGTRYANIKEDILAFNKEVQDISLIDQSIFAVSKILDSYFAIPADGIDIGRITFNSRSMAIQIVGVAKNRDILLKYKDLLSEQDLTLSEVEVPVNVLNQKTNISINYTILLDKTKLPKYGQDEEDPQL